MWSAMCGRQRDYGTARRSSLQKPSHIRRSCHPLVMAVEGRFRLYRLSTDSQVRRKARSFVVVSIFVPSTGSRCFSVPMAHQSQFRVFAYLILILRGAIGTVFVMGTSRPSNLKMILNVTNHLRNSPSGAARELLRLTRLPVLEIQTNAIRLFLTAELHCIVRVICLQEQHVRNP